MALADLGSWLVDNSKPGVEWYAKRLAGNDTLATGAHQAGPYVPKEFLFKLFPQLNRPEDENPRVEFPLYVESHGQQRDVQAIWYNNKLRGGTRNEARLTNFGGQSSPLLDPESTGAIAVFAFHPAPPERVSSCRVWVCTTAAEEDLVEDHIGPVEPGRLRYWSVDPGWMSPPEAPKACWMQPEEIPHDWLHEFPTGAAIMAKTLARRPLGGKSVDERLMLRRDCEFELFRSLEQHLELPAVRAGFQSIDEFVARAQTILQRRKARSGRSLELHVRQVFLEEGMREHSDFAAQPSIENGKRPDFLFPSVAAYNNPAWPAEKLCLLAIKTTCKDRWRQVLNEADRIPRKHLLTLQEGVSEAQFREMEEAKVQLVVPSGLVTKYPASVQGRLVTVAGFLTGVKSLGR